MRFKNKKIPIFIAALFLIGTIAIFFIAPYAILKPPRNTEKTTPEKFGLIYEHLNIKSEGGINLNGYWIRTKKDTAKGIIILIHGVGGCKEHFLGLANELNKLGIESIVFDGRAHGKSGGKYCTYGFKEKKDVSKIIDFIKNKNPDLPIGIWGNSLGGAVAIQSLEFDKRIRFGIIESTFTDLSQIVFDYQKRYLKGIGLRFLSDFILRRAGEISGYDPMKIKPINSVKNIGQPVFMAHGDADKNISFKYGQQLFENLRSEEKEFFRIKNGAHYGLMSTGGEEYKNKLFSFINKQLSNGE